MTDPLPDLTENSPLFGALLESTDDLVWAVDVECRFLAFNSALWRHCQRNLGFEPSHGRSAVEPLPDEARVRWEAYYHRAICDGPFTEEYETFSENVVLLLSFGLLKRNEQVFGVCVFGKDITERRRSERALAFADDRFAKLIRTSPWLISLTTLKDAVILAVNDAFARTLEYRPEQLIGSSTLALGIWSDPSQRDQLRSALFDKGRAVQQNVRFRTRTGRELYFQVNAEAVQFDDQPCIFTSAVDITDRLAAELALRRADEFNRTLLSTMKALVVVLERDGRIVQFNAACERLSGRQVHDAIGRHVWELMVPDDQQAEVRNVIAKLVGGEFPLVYEHDWLTGDGKRRSITWTAAVLRDNNGDVEFVVQTGLDITERRQTDVALRESEERYRTLVDYAPEAIVVLDVDQDLRFVDCNENACNLFGLARRQLLTRSPIDVSPDCQPGGTTSIALATVHVSEALEGRSQVFEWMHRRSDGELRPCEVRLVKLPSSSHRLLRGSIVDISARKRLEQQTAELQARLDQAQRLEAIGTLAGGIAHDFNNILGAIIGSLDLAVLDLPDDAPARPALADMERAAYRAADLVRQILAFSRNSPEERQAVQFDRVVKEVVKLIRATLPSTISILERRESSACVMADPSQLHQIVMNLCTNAGLAMAQTGGVLCVKLHETNADAELLGRIPNLLPGRYLCLTIKDTGTGIAPEHLGRIFEPFFTTRPKGKGTGLGLSVVHGIVKEAGGAVDVESQLGVGTTFRVFLPSCDGASKTLAEVPVVREGCEHVIVVDDEVDLTEIARAGLEHYGYRVTVYNHPELALAAMLRDPKGFDVLVTDMTMPGFTGDRLATQIRRLRPDVPVILVTGYSERMSVEQAKAAGVAEYIEKPFRPTKLAEVIRRLCDQSKQLR